MKNFLALIVLLSVGLFACPAPPPTCVIRTNPPNVTTQQGKTSSFYVDADASCGSYGTISLSIDNPNTYPFTVVFNPQVGIGRQAIGTVQAPLSATLGAYTLTVRATASGGAITTPLTVIISAAPPPPPPPPPPLPCNLELSPQSLSISPSTQQNLSVKPTAGCSAYGALTLSIDSPASYPLSIGFNPPTLGTLSQATVTAPANATTSSHTLTVRATSSSGFSTITPLYVFIAPDQPTATIGSAGGFLKLGRFMVNVPSGILNTSVNFTAQRLSTPPVSFPSSDEFNLTRVGGAQLVGVFKLTGNITNLSKPIQVLLPDDLATPSEAVITEIYRYTPENGYTTLQITQGGDLFLHEPTSLSPQGDTFVIYRAKKTNVASDCPFDGFNGMYCEFPFDNNYSTVLPRAITTQAKSSATYGVVSFNVGNAIQSGPNNTPFYCGDYPPNYTDAKVASYRYKLCSYAIERQVRRELQRDNGTGKDLDLIALQEVWNDDCSTSEDNVPAITFPKPINVVGPGPVVTVIRQVGNSDRVCAYKDPNQPKKQIDRLLPNTYDKRCLPTRQFPNTPRKADRVVNGYECIAIRKDHFEFTNAGNYSSIQPACPNATQNNLTYYLGSDTGFQVERIRLKGAIGNLASVEFEFVNGHMISPPSSDCRNTQLQALANRYKNTPTRILVAGDFNTDPLRSVYPLDDVPRNTFIQMFGSFTEPLNTTPSALRIGYLLSNPLETTSNLLVLGDRALDHLMSNFATTIFGAGCVRRTLVQGTDHKRTFCLLRGFDTTRYSGSMTVTNLSIPNATPQSWDGIGTGVSSRGVFLNYVQQITSSGSLLVNYLPDNLDAILKYKACPSQATSQDYTVTGRQPSSTPASFGPVRFSIFLQQYIASGTSYWGCPQ
jgi:hypothetical protein